VKWIKLGVASERLKREELPRDFTSCKMAVTALKAQEQD
jgi:hypothetical protein